MRISVCEFLRITTQLNWFYLNPGHWASDRYQFEARRDNPDDHTIKLYKGRRFVRNLTYFEGRSSHEVRKNNRKR